MDNVYSDKALATSCVKIKCIFSSVKKRVGIHVGPTWLAACPKMSALNSETATFRETDLFSLDGNHVFHNLCFCNVTLNLGFACQR